MNRQTEIHTNRMIDKQRYRNRQSMRELVSASKKKIKRQKQRIH